MTKEDLIAAWWYIVSRRLICIAILFGLILLILFAAWCIDRWRWHRICGPRKKGGGGS